MQFVLMSITSPLRIQQLIELQANRRQSTLGPSTGVLEVPAPSNTAETSSNSVITPAVAPEESLASQGF